MPKPRKGSDKAWTESLKPKAQEKAGSAATPPGKGTLYADIPLEDLENLRDLARYRSRQEGRKVTIAELTAEAVRDLLTKHAEQRKGR